VSSEIVATEVVPLLTRHLELEPRREVVTGSDIDELIADADTWRSCGLLARS